MSTTEDTTMTNLWRALNVVGYAAAYEAEQAKRFGTDYAQPYGRGNFSYWRERVLGFSQRVIADRYGYSL